MEKSWAVKNRSLITGIFTVALTGLVVLSLSLMGVSCATVELSRYDPNHGETAEDIRKNFNLGHANPWDYYCRGAVYLAFGHYQEALGDFNDAIRIKERDRRNINTYGMHFIDYFPHRESGVAYYFMGELAKTADRKEQNYNKAIKELEISYSYEETARAQSYLNLARRALWNITKMQDRIPPIIRMNVAIPIYTNRSTVRFDVTATDAEDGSYVGDVRVDRSEGDVRIERLGPSTEFAQREVTTPVKITLGPGEKKAVVAITASDLAGNTSETRSVPIILDTQAPTAGISIVADPQPSDGLVRISIEAQDDLGLRQIQVGKDPSSKVECDGAPKYTGTLSGSPDGKKLAIKLIDNAGNSTLVSIPVEEAADQDRLPSAPRSKIPGRLSRTDALDIHSYSRRLSRAYFAGSDPGLPHRAIHLSRTVNADFSPLTVARARRPSKKPELGFEPYVYPIDPNKEAKETSEPDFTVAGWVRDPLYISRIKVELVEQNEPNEQSVELRLERKEKDYRTFSYSLDLTKVPFDKARTVSVKAYADAYPGDTPLSKMLRVIKREDPSQYADAIYGILVLPLSPSFDNGYTAPKASWAPSRLVSVYEDLVAELKARKMPDRNPESLLKDVNAFRVYEIGDLYTDASIEEWCKKPKNVVQSVARDLRIRQKKRVGSEDTDSARIDPNVIDLVVYGELKIHSITKENEPNVEDVTIELRAMDVSSKRFLRFPNELGDTDNILAEAEYKQYSEEYSAQGMQQERPNKQTFKKKKQWAIRNLAWHVAQNIPRLRPSVIDYDAVSPGAKDTRRFELGSDDGVFLGMRAWLYTQDTVKNALLKKVDCYELRDFDSNHCWITCDKDLSKPTQPPPYGCVLITK